MPKHQWTKTLNVKTALELLEESPNTRCRVLGCKTVLFRIGSYCLKHQIFVKKIKGCE